MQCLDLGGDDAIHSCGSSVGSDLSRISSLDNVFWKEEFRLFIEEKNP